MMPWIESALDGIKKVRISHRNYERALAEAAAAVAASVPGEVVCITGPSRVGKSRLAADLRKLLGGDGSPCGHGLMPSVSVLVTNCTYRGYFRTKDFIVACLEAIHHPIYGVPAADDPWDTARQHLLEKTSEGTLSKSFLKAIELRRTVFVFFDEVQHFQYALGGAAEAAAILDSWKSFAAKANVILVLLGAYPIVDVLQLCPHLLGRKRQVHFPRYLVDEADLLSFQQILDTYCTFLHLPPDVPSLRCWNDLLYEKSFGCIGLLEGHLRDALAKAGAEESPYLTKAHLLATCKPRGDLEEIASEIARGEHAMEFGAFLGKDDSPIEIDANRAKSAHKPFQKKPRRYKIGGRL